MPTSPLKPIKLQLGPIRTAERGNESGVACVVLAILLFVCIRDNRDHDGVIQNFIL